MTSPPFWIGTSWKMNKTLSQAMEFATTVAASDAAQQDDIQAFVIPPFTAVRQVADHFAKLPIKVGAQNMHWDDAGAWTGEVSPLMVADCGAEIVELGHSERRAHFNETNETVGRKTAAALRHGLIPLICIGETLDEREQGRAQDVLGAQVRGALEMVADRDKHLPLLFAYEPVWAIGDGGIPASASYADARHSEIIGFAADILGRRPPCLYGGSVNAENCTDLIQCPHIDGLFIGRAAWAASGYLDILTRCRTVLKQKEME